VKNNKNILTARKKSISMITFLSDSTISVPEKRSLIFIVLRIELYAASDAIKAISAPERPNKYLSTNLFLSKPVSTGLFFVCILKIALQPSGDGFSISMT